MNEYKIKTVVFKFYEKATSDPMIGYHFRKIATRKGDNPLNPPMDSFRDHLPRIEAFWESQLLGIPPKSPFDLLNVHRALSIRRGELGRWLTLFREVLAEEIQDEKVLKSWNEKLIHFEKIFIQKLFP